MTPLVERRIMSLTRHITTAGSGGTVGVSLIPNDVTLFGVPVPVWTGILTMVAGCVNAWFSKTDDPPPPNGEQPQ